MNINDFTNPEIVSVAVALLGGEAEFIDREDIAIEVNDIAPGRFNWRKFPDRIDLDSVGVALRDAKKPKNGGLLVGSNSKGWMLSPKGLIWISNIDLSEILVSNLRKNRRESLFAFQESECLRLRNTRAFIQFMNGEVDKIELQDFFQFVRINEYFQTKSRQRRYSIIDNAVVADETLSKLWEYLKKKFIEEIN